MTETCGAALQTAPSDPDDIRRTSVGRPLAGTEVLIAAQDGEPTMPDEAGELWLRGARLTRGYYQDPEATAATIDSEGWLHTGDLAVMDAHGTCRVIGRLKDRIKTGGENVSPDEVEEVVVSHPSVAQAAVVGAPSERWGELVIAFVVPAPATRSTRHLSSSTVASDCRRSRCRGRGGWSSSYP
jgi:fatty-acyl-CoA synthase